MLINFTFRKPSYVNYLLKLFKPDINEEHLGFHFV